MLQRQRSTDRPWTAAAACAQADAAPVSARISRRRATRRARGDGRRRCGSGAGQAEPSTNGRKEQARSRGRGHPWLRSLRSQRSRSCIYARPCPHGRLCFLLAIMDAKTGLAIALGAGTLSTLAWYNAGRVRNALSRGMIKRSPLIEGLPDPDPLMDFDLANSNTRNFLYANKVHWPSSAYTKVILTFADRAVPVLPDDGAPAHAHQPLDRD
jgi:hypothetical protein